MAEIMSQLERIAYLMGTAASVAERRELDELLRQTETQVDAGEPADEVREVVAA